jgi:division/cell wall cluster transcriptional repressor MraZ
MDSAQAQRTKLDRGRLRIPARFRQLLQDDVVLANYFQGDGHERCLLLFTPDEWAKFEATLDGTRSDDRELRLCKTFFLGAAAKLAIDRQGRVALPTLLRKFLSSATVLVCRPDPRWINVTQDLPQRSNATTRVER